MNYNPVPNSDRQAAALAEIKHMHDELTDSQATVLQLKADLNRETDRCIMITEERDRFRADNNLLRSQLLKACTTISNMGLLARDAEALLTTLSEHDVKDTQAMLTLEEIAAEPTV